MKKGHKISGYKTISKLRNNKKLYKKVLKKTIALSKKKLEKYKEDVKADIKTKIIAESVVKIFELPLHSLITGNFFKKFATQIWKDV